MKETVKAPYEHHTELKDIKKNYRNEDGEIVVGPKNILTNPLKLGSYGKNVFFGGVIPWMKEDYDVNKELAKKELEYHHSKCQDKPFSQRAKS